MGVLKVKNIWIKALATGGLLAISATTFADNMSCGTRLVTQGMSKAAVEEICGEPTSIEQSGTTWVYDQGATQFLKVIIFVNGEVEFINDRSREVGPD